MIGLHVDHRDVGVGGEGLEDGVLPVLLPVHEFGEGPDPDQVAIAGEDLGRLFDVLLGVIEHHSPVFELQRPHPAGGGEHDGVASQLVGADVERGAGAQGVVEEEQGNGLPLEGLAMR